MHLNTAFDPSHVFASAALFFQANPIFDPYSIARHRLIFAPFFLAFGLVGVVLMLIPWWFIFKKAGFSPWLCLLMILPVVNLVMLYVVAFSQWRVAPTTDIGGVYRPPV